MRQKSALETMTDFLNTHHGDMERIIFNVFQDSDREIYQRLFGLNFD